MLFRAEADADELQELNEFAGLILGESNDANGDESLTLAGPYIPQVSIY